jgi:acetyl esterase/lipase
MKPVFQLLFLCLSQIAVAQNYVRYNNIPYDTIPGVPAERLMLDIYVPNSPQGLKPVLIYNHGGFFTGNGDKGNLNFKDEVFADSGYVTVSINHRKYAAGPFPPFDPDRVIYPVPAEDAARAIRWIFDNIGQYGGDVTRMGIIGHSSGGHQISILSTDENLLGAVGLPLSTLKCACALDPGGYDIPIYLDIAVNAQVQSYQNAFGVGDTARWIMASPARQVKTGNGTPEFYLVASENNKKRFLMHLMADSLAAHGVAVDTFYSATLEHADVDNYIGAPGDTIMTWRVMGFLKNCFGKLTTSVEDAPDVESKSSGFRVFPNPAHGVINLLFEEAIYGESLLVTDVFGRVVLQKNMEAEKGTRVEIVAHSWDSGMYLVRIGQRQVKRIVILD